MSPDEELAGLALLIAYLFSAPAATALCAVPLGMIYGVVAGLRSRRNALPLIAVPAFLAALLVTLLACGLPIWAFARAEGLPGNEFFPVLVGTLVTFTVALVGWSLPIGAAVSVSRVFATRGWKPTIVTLAAALLVTALVALALPAICLVPTSPLFSEQAALGDWILPATIIFGSTYALCCIFFGPIVRLVGWTQPRPNEPELPLPLEPVAEKPIRQMKWTRHQRIVMAVLAGAVVAVFGCLGVYLSTHLIWNAEDRLPQPSPTPHPLPPTSTPTLIPLNPTSPAPIPTYTLVIPRTPTATPRPCPPAPTAAMAPELLELRDSVGTEEERLMVAFLMSRYDPSLGLLEESPHVGAGRFFIHADAYLAGLDTSWYDKCHHIEPSPHWRVLRDRVALPEDQIMWDVKLLDLGDGVYSYQPNANSVMPLELWADRLLLAALSAKLSGNHAREEELLAQARDMWDGKCLQDEYYQSHERKYGYPACETFKTALYYHLTGDEDALAILRKMQETDPASPNYGGIYNLYDQNGDRFPPGEIDANSETTAVVLLSFRSCAQPPARDIRQELLDQWESAETDQERLMVEFLMKRYNPTLGLLEESPNVGRGKYYVHSDAYLAGLDTTTYDRKYGIRPNPHWTVLRGEVVSEEVFSYGVEERELDPANRVFSIIDRPDIVWFDWQEYADRVLLAALSARQAENHAREAELMAIAHAIWDGHCMRDKSYYSYLDNDRRVTCETYKTALYYHLTGDHTALDTVLALQERNPASENFGGIYTHYGEDGKPFPWVDANTETTAVVLLTIHR